ncbi:BOP1NT domain protein [Necator americanus]|uniref:Ribosome biogenesis protein BOP1 homolog n=1 Tax=Necator americanus TaxID=51031 RepID=W2SK42_NECAM|nr:BOP1NT domain protein [Necator americanus]ETN69112.1 BOP1NT domain protein [Necator americanus]
MTTEAEAEMTTRKKRALADREKKTKVVETKTENENKSERDIKHTRKKRVADEYDYDSSDEEDLRNTIGNIPVQWYDDESHIGYDQKGEKIAKPKKKTEIDTFLEKMEDPDYWRKVFDRQSGTDVVLTDEQVEKLSNIASGKYPVVGYNPYEPFLDIFSSQKSIHPIDNRPEPKARFIPSKDEMKIVSRMVHAIKMGWARKPKPKEEQKMYDLWAAEDSLDHKTKSELARMRMHMPAPKMPLPIHAESYNPPAEYLFDEGERKKFLRYFLFLRWEESEPEDRRISFIPRKYDALRKVPQYDKFITERFERCLDLYLAPRKIKMKLQVDPSELLPDLPNPNDLRPFPTTLAFYMRGHVGQVRSISVEPDLGELLVSGGEDGTVRFWMMGSGRCIKTHKVAGPVTSVAFCPVNSKSLVAVAYEGRQVAVFNTCCGDKLICSQTDEFIREVPVEESEGNINWRRVKDRIVLEMPNEVRKVVWHNKGDYFASVAVDDIATSVYIHQLSRARSQCPFTKRKGYVQTVVFHPILPRLFVATKIHVRVYDLGRCQLVKKCITGIKHISVIFPDVQGENLFVGGLDRKFAWLDLQLSNKPWKTFKHHKSAIRGVAYHKRYPLLATVSDDGTAMVYYARIHVDLLKDNEIYPVKRLRGHTTVNGLCMLDTVWHPTQPWLITAGADGTIALFSY